MFGYIRTDKPELKIKDFDKYRAYYCGLCRKLKQKYGLTAQLMLNYDMVFLILLLSGLDDCNTKKERHSCMVYPLKHDFLENIYTDYCADMLVILGYFKAKDDFHDERKISGKTFSILLNRAFLKCKSKYPKKTDEIKRNLESLSLLEKSNCSDIEKLSDLSGSVLGEVFKYPKSEWTDELYKTGYYIGRYIYVLDAFDDVEKDIKNNQFNLLIKDFTGLSNETFNKKYELILKQNIAQASKEIEELPIIENIDIIRNIIYSGVWTEFYRINQKRKEEKIKKEKNNE